jgi:hypothetical protein
MVDAPWTVPVAAPNETTFERNLPAQPALEGANC